MYTGQAIMKQSCANGCHSSTAEGQARQGAPKGLDFDLLPLSEGTPVTGTDGVVRLQLDPQALADLRHRQRKVYDEREDIWEQIQKGLMPPESTFEVLTTIVESMFNNDGSCTRGQALTSLDADKEKLRNWLACGTPIVEANSAQLTVPVVGTVGNQYPVCGGGGGGSDGGMPTTPGFSEVYNTVFAACAACHVAGGASGTMFHLNTEDIAYTALLGATGTGAPQSCAANPTPYVTPGDPTKSYIVAKVDKSAPVTARCGGVMPDANGINATSLDLLKRWIAGGAPRMPTSANIGSSDDAGIDAGL